MRISLDLDKCQGHGRCAMLSPDLFDLDDRNQAVLLVGGEVPPALAESARQAQMNCPEGAITLLP